MAETAVDLLLENLKQVINGSKDSKLEEKDRLESLCEELGFLRTFLEGWEEKICQNEELRALERRIIDLAHEAENAIGLVTGKRKDNSVTTKMMKHIRMFGRICVSFDHSSKIDRVRQEIGVIKTESMKFFDKKVNEMGKIQVVKSSTRDPSRADTATREEEIMVGFENEAMNLKERLTRGPKRLEIVSIVGMAGLGKTTLARKVYNDPLVVYHFYIRAWVDVSQEHQKMDLLTRLVRSVIQRPKEIDRMNESELAQLLYQTLKGRVYFIVMDDVWDHRAWDDLKSCLPNDNNGSRIMFTSRHESVALLAKSSSPPLSLRFLTSDESWDLFQQKVFRRETCPPELVKLGQQITMQCQGLPLAIVVVAGILANKKKSQDGWKQVGETMNSSMASDPQLWEKTLALSYNHLPHHLKHCFLYFGAFREDSQIPVWKLIWLWVAEGFVIKTEEQSVEEVARGYLLDLIGRSLILVSRRGYDGRVKACGIHDLLRDFCIKQAEKERFLEQISSEQFFSFYSKRLWIKDSENAWTATSVLVPAWNTKTLLCFRSKCTGSRPPHFCYASYDLLRVFIIKYRVSDIYGIGKLAHLRFLEVCTSETCFPASIIVLQNLETLIIDARSTVTLPQCIRKLVKLRQIRLTGPGGLKIEGQDPEARYPFSLDDLQTLSWVNPFFCEDFIAGTPNLIKLGLRGFIVNRRCLRFPDLYFLNHLQELKLYNTRFAKRGTHLEGIRFPTTLKKLTLAGTYLSWDEMSTLETLLPTLEVLKLLHDAFTGPVWETSEGFPRLEFLEFKSLDMVQWNASSSHFPRLQKLVLVDCHQLKTIPSEMGDILTLETIEIASWNPSRVCGLVNSARQIKEEQETMGNSLLQVVTPATI